jgi:hypothetical protein
MQRKHKTGMVPLTEVRKLGPKNWSPMKVVIVLYCQL